MGSWGSGILDNDSALDYIGNLIDRVINDLVKDLETLEDGILEREYGACLSVLCTFADSYPTTLSSGLEISTIEKWREQVSAWLTHVISTEQQDRDSWEEHKSVIVDEFNRLISTIKLSQ